MLFEPKVSLGRRRIGPEDPLGTLGRAVREKKHQTAPFEENRDTYQRVRGKDAAGRGCKLEARAFCR